MRSGDRGNVRLVPNAGCFYVVSVLERKHSVRNRNFKNMVLRAAYGPLDAGRAPYLIRERILQNVNEGYLELKNE